MVSCPGGTFYRSSITWAFVSRRTTTPLKLLEGCQHGSLLIADIETRCVCLRFGTRLNERNLCWCCGRTSQWRFFDCLLAADAPGRRAGQGVLGAVFQQVRGIGRWVFDVGVGAGSLLLVWMDLQQFCHQLRTPLAGRCRMCHGRCRLNEMSTSPLRLPPPTTTTRLRRSPPTPTPYFNGLSPIFQVLLTLNRNWRCVNRR